MEFLKEKKKNGVESEQCLLVLTLAILFAFWRDCWSLYFIFVGLLFKMERKMALENLLKSSKAVTELFLVPLLAFPFLLSSLIFDILWKNKK